MDPIAKFEQWYHEELRKSTATVPSACCLSTIGTDGYPNARYVSLKEVKDGTFIITGPLLSRKGVEITAIPKVALTFWWEATQKQVRIQGDANRIDNAAADKYFEDRERDSCIVSFASRQGETINDVYLLHQTYKDVEQRFHNKPIPRPEDWGGFYITPIRIEFFAFSQNRFHERELYQTLDSGWKLQLLQP
ncbi:MAG: pyridoxal 5'-phosphate synthase [Chitinophagaceae bacterium]